MYVFDVEVYPNFFSVVIKHYHTKEKWVYEISERRNDVDKIREFFNQKTYFIGFNSKHYDNIIIAVIQSHKVPKEELLEKCFYISSSIFNDNYDIYKQYKYYKHPFRTIDLYLYWSKMLRLSKILSLKSIACQLNFHNIQELPFKPEESLPLNAIDKVLQYNENDVDVTIELATKLRDDVNLRSEIERIYGIDALSKDGVNMGVEILLSEYCKHTQLDKEYVKELRTKRNDIKLEDIIFDNINFKHRVNSNYQINKNGAYVFKSFQEMFEHLRKRVVHNTSELKYTVFWKNVKFDYGSGGIHGICSDTIIEPKDDEVIIDADVALNRCN